MSAQPIPSAVPAEVKSDRFPPGVPYIVGNEGAERFSFYGMKAILKIYLIMLFVRFVDEKAADPVMMAEARARSTEVVHLFVAGVYAFPLLGAILSDRLLGKYNVIFWVSLIYVAGHGVLAVAGRLGAMSMYSAAELSMYLGLALIAIGSGGIKPCVSANVGDQFTKENGHMVGQIFQIFYFIINFGSFFSTLLTPILLREFGPEIAFGVPGVLMLIATIVFWSGRHKFIRVPPKPGGKLGLLDTVVTTLLFSPLFAIIVGYFVLWEGFVHHAEEAWTKANEAAIAAATAAGNAVPEFAASSVIGDYFAHYWWLPAGTIAAVVVGFVLFKMRQRIAADNGFLPVFLYNLTHQKEKQPGESFFDVGRKKFGEEAGDGPPAVLKIMVVFSMVSVFWALFDQHASTWVDQAGQMALGLRLPAFFGWWAIGWNGFGGVVALTLIAGIWLFRWIGNKPLSRQTTLAAVGTVLAFGVGALLLDLVAPWNVGNRVHSVVIKADSKDTLRAANAAIEELPASSVSIVTIDSTDGVPGERDARLAARSHASLYAIATQPDEAAQRIAAEGKVEVKTFPDPAAFIADLTATRERMASEPAPRIMSIQMDKGQLSSLNPLMVMLIIPGLNFLVYRPLRKRGIEVKPLQKMTAGMFLAAFCFAAAAILQKAIESAGDGQIHALWQAGPYFIMTTAEVLVSITGLEFAYTQAPRAMKSTIMGFWLLCVTFGNLLVAFLAPLQKTYDLSQFFWLFAGLMAGASIIFAILAYLYKGKSYLQEAGSH